jgi:hypothetical protein
MFCRNCDYNVVIDDPRNNKVMENRLYEEEEYVPLLRSRPLERHDSVSGGQFE